jgi:RimJ/RimL family protein N-acetyltransferase
MGSDLIVETQRLELRPLEPADRAGLHAVFIDTDVRRYLTDGREMSREWVDTVIQDSVASFERVGVGMWGVRERGVESLIGFTGYREFYDPPVLELLYGLLPDFWGRGLATEMAEVALGFGFEGGRMDEIRASTDGPNVASENVMKRLGMRFQSREPAEPWDQIHYVISRAAWEARTA